MTRSTQYQTRLVGSEMLSGVTHLCSHEIFRDGIPMHRAHMSECLAEKYEENTSLRRDVGSSFGGY